jgi:hypothetical protein
MHLGAPAVVLAFAAARPGLAAAAAGAADANNII